MDRIRHAIGASRIQQQSAEQSSPKHLKTWELLAAIYHEQKEFDVEKALRRDLQRLSSTLGGLH